MKSLPPEKPPGNGSLSRQAISRLAFPFARQQTVNEQLFTAVRLLSENMRELHRASLRRHMALDQQSAAAEQLLAENRSLPYMAGSPFMLYGDPVAGRVQGYVKQGVGSEATGVYHAFEDVFRGPEKLIRDRQRRYLDLLGGRGPVVDVGCGRGEFLDLLREQRLEYTGVDMDPEMVEYCRSKGHERVEQADANSYLEGCPDDSIGVIFCAQVIEHLPYKELLRFFELGRQKLEPGGLFIAETVNPHSVRALKAFWVDPTHQHPIFPEVALALSKIEGFESAYVFHPNGSGDIEADRFDTGEYAVVATKATRE